LKQCALAGSLGIKVLESSEYPVRPEALQDGVRVSPDVLRTTAIQPVAGLAILQTEFRRNHHSIAKRLDCFPHKLFVRVGAVRLRRIEEGSNAARIIAMPAAFPSPDGQLRATGLALLAQRQRCRCFITSRRCACGMMPLWDFLGF
jgi:hypothetical protein